MSTRLRAFLASFAVYLIPIVLPHTVLFLGAALFQELSSERHHKDALWIAADVALVLILQLAAAFLWYGFFRVRWRLVGFLAALPVFVAVAEVGYMLVIPSVFLIEKDRTVDRMEWAVECTVPGYVLPSLKTTADVERYESTQVWAMNAESLRLATLTMPECRIQDLDLAWSNVGTVPASTIPGGRMLLVTYHDDGSQSWEVFDEGKRGGVFPRPPNTGQEWAVLSNDGRWIGWVQRESRRDLPHTVRVLLQPVVGGDEKLIDLSGVGAGRFALLSVVPPELLLEHDYGEFVGIDMEGRVRWGPVRPERVEASGSSFLRVDRGWIAWDAYRDRGPYRIQWSLAGGDGYHEILRGRGITSLAADPEGRFIAVSLTTSLNIGSFGDKVYVIRGDNGGAVFQESLPRYARSQVTFVGSRFFAYSRERDIRVLRIPD